jgi:hypothetical protein
MLLVAKQGARRKCRRFSRSGTCTPCGSDGHDDGLMRVKNHGKVVAEIPNTR